MKTCTFCHWEGPDDSMFCGQCGRRLINPGDTFTGSSDTRISGSHAPDDTGTFIGENTPFKLSDSGEKTEEELEHEILHPFDDIDSEQTIKAIHDTKKEEEEDEDRLIPLPPMWGSNRVQPADNILAQDALHIDQVPEGNIPHIPGQPPPMASPPVSQAAQVFQVSPPPSQATAPPHPWYSQGHPHPPHPHRPPIQRHIRPTCLIVVIVAFIVASTIIAIITFFLKPTPPPPNPTAQLVGKPIPGLSMILRGSRFVPAETVTIVIDNKPVASNGSYPSNSMSMGRIFLQKASQAPPAGAKKTVSEDGTFSHTILVDLRWPVGSSHTVYVYRQDGTFIQLPPFTVYMPSVRTGLLGCLNEAAPITLGPISEGSIQPVSKTITLCTQGSGSVNWTATWDQKWLQLPSSGQIQAPQQGNLTLTGSANGLAPGAYTTTVVFSSRQSLTSVPLSVVLAVVKAGTSQIPTQKKGVECVSASPRSISFANVADAAAALSKSVTVNNCGDAGAWSASVSTSDGKQWLGISPSGDKLQSGGLQDVGITTSSANLSPGKYTGQVTFQIGSSSANVQVTFTVWPPQPPPCISASSQSLTFVSIAGQSTPPSQAIKLINCGAAGQWSLSAVTDDGKDWAQFNPSSHALKEREVQQVNVSVSSAQLEKGTYTGKIIVSMGSSSATVNITFIVEGSCLQIDYSSLLFKSTVGKGALEDPVTITNCGYPDSWYASASTDDGADWLTITRTYDQLPAKASQRIGVIASGAQLHKGTYTGHILFIMGGSTATVRVTLIIAGTPPCISTNMDLLEFTSFQGENPDPQVVTVGNCGSAEGSWISSVNGTPWIRTDLSRGGLKSMDVQDIRVSLSSKQLPVGTYRGGITFSMGPNSKDVQILLTVQPPPPHVCITPDPSSLEFSSTIVDGKVSSPKAQAVQITNCGDSGTLSVSAVTNDGAPWLGVNLPTENLNAGETSNVPVAVDSTNLGNGTYTATIRFTITTSTGGTGVVNVRVILTVSQITSICTANPSTLTFTSTWGEPSPEAQNSILTNCGANDTWEESDYSGELFHVGPHLGTLDNNGSQVVSVSPGSYTPDPGKHTYTLTFTTGAGKRASVETTWIILPPPNPTCIQADPSSINFSDHYTNTLAPVSFTNCGALPGNVTVTGTTSDGTNWLIINSHDPIDGSGSYSTRYGPSISVRIDPTNLEPGPHYGSVTASIKTSQGSNSVTVGVTFTVPAPPPPPTPTPVPIATSGVTPTDTSTPGVTPTDTSTPTPPSPTPPSPSPTNTPPAPPTETPTPTPAPPSPTPTPPPAPPTETPTPTPTPPPAPPTETPTPTPAPPPPTPTPPPAPPPPTPTSTQTNPQSFSLPPGFAYTDMDNRRHLLMVEHSHHRILDVNGDS